MKTLEELSLNELAVIVEEGRKSSKAGPRKFAWRAHPSLKIAGERRIPKTLPSKETSLVGEYSMKATQND